MARVPQLLLETLEELSPEQLRTFHFYLYSDVLEGFQHIPRSRVDGVDRPGTVNVLVQTYGYEDAVTVTVDILGKMKLKLHAKRLKKKYKEGKM